MKRQTGVFRRKEGNPSQVRERSKRDGTKAACIKMANESGEQAVCDQLVKFVKFHERNAAIPAAAASKSPWQRKRKAPE